MRNTNTDLKKSFCLFSGLCSRELKQGYNKVSVKRSTLIGLNSMLYDSTKYNLRKITPTSAEMTSFLICPFGIVEELEEHFIYDFHNQEKNEFLGAVDLQAVIVTDRVDQ